MRQVLLGLACLLATALLAACSANYHSVYRNRDLSPDHAQVITVDAKQRAILTTPAVSGETTTTTVGQRTNSTTGVQNGSTVTTTVTEPMIATRWRFCSEPSPDVYSVIAQALGAGGSFGKAVDPVALEAAFNLAFSSSEQGSTIPRTQTINMLRELMFRTCERYLSGGYDDMELSVQAVRDQRLMVSILAIEQLTGAVTPRPVVIGASAGSASGASGDAIIRLDDARKARDTAVAAYRSAQSAYDALNGETKVCDTIADKTEADLSTEQRAKVKPCNDARSARTTALGEQTAKTAAYQELSALARAGGVSVSSSLSSNVTGGLDRADPQAVSEVGKVVSDIITHNFSDNSEVMLFCLRVLRPGPAQIAQESVEGIKSVCTEYIQREVRAAGLIATANAERLFTAEAAASRLTEQTEKERAFAEFWPSKSTLFGNAQKRADFVALLKGRLPRSKSALADCFADKATESGVKSCFFALPLVNIRELIR